MVVFISSCDEVNLQQIPVTYDYGYFPLKPRLWKTYKVQSITIDKDAEVFDTLNYYVKEVQASWFLNASNDSMIRLERYYRDSLNQSWKIWKVWQMGISNHEVLQIEDNITYLKLKFPLALDATWNGDAYNRQDTLQKYSYRVIGLDDTDAYGSIAFDKVLTVSEKYTLSLVDMVDFEEKYAYDLGMVYRKQIDIYSSDVDAAIPIENRVTKGTIYYQEILDYGEE